MAPTFFFEGVEVAFGSGVVVGETLPITGTVDVVEVAVLVDRGADVGVNCTPVYTIWRYRSEGCP
jgi:hypothetical protein